MPVSKPRKPKPIRVVYGELSGRFWATRSYRETADGHLVVTGEKFDVTNDIARIIIERGITFVPGPLSEAESATPEPPKRSAESGEPGDA